MAKRRGRPPKSARERELEGNPGKRPIKEIPPDPEPIDVSRGHLEPPEGIRAHELKIWEQTVAAFPDWYFTAADRDLLLQYCRCKYTLDRASRSLSREKLLAERGSGAKCVNPLVTAVQAETALLIKLSRELGLAREKRQHVAQVDPERVPEPEPEGKTELGGGDPDGFGNLIAPAAFAHRG